MAGARREQEEALCAQRIAELTKRSLWTGNNPLVLPAGGKRYLIGSLAMTEKGKALLAVGGYRTRHHHLHLALEIATEEEDWGRLNYEWLGEMELVNDHRFETVGQVKTVTPVAGYWASDLHGLAGNFNTVDRFREILSERFSDVLVPTTRYLSYEDAVRLGEVHLQKRLRKFLKAFEKLKERGQIAARETYRHYIGNRIQNILSSISHILREDNDDSRAKKQANLLEVFDPPLSLESMYLYLSWLENDGVRHPSIEPMKEMLKKFDREHKLSYRDWLSFNESGGNLMTFVFGKKNKVSLEEWMAFGGIASDFLDLATQLNDEAAKTGEAQIVLLDPALP